MNISKQLKSERERLNLTQAEAAMLCGVSPRTWWRLENNLYHRAIVAEWVLERLKNTKLKGK